MSVPDEVADMARTHRGGEGCVWLTRVLADDGEEHAVFSTLQLAIDHVLTNYGDDSTCIYVPMVVDMPELGSSPVN